MFEILAKMKLNSLEAAAEKAKIALEQVPDDMCWLYTHTEALRGFVANTRKELLYHATSPGAAMDKFHVANSMRNLVGILTMEHTVRGLGLESFSNAKTMLAELEGSTEYKAARNIIEPLLESKKQADAALAEHRQKLADKQHALNEATAAARAKALAGVTAHPDVVAARSALEKLDAP